MAIQNWSTKIVQVTFSDGATFDFPMESIQSQTQINPNIIIDDVTTEIIKIHQTADINDKNSKIKGYQNLVKSMIQPTQMMDLEQDEFYKIFNFPLTNEAQCLLEIE